MQRQSVTVALLFVALLAIATAGINSCAKKEKKKNTQLISPAAITTEDREYLTRRGLLESGEDILYLYYQTDITEEGILLTNKKIAVFSAESIKKEFMETIFDLSSSHAVSPEKKSRITVFRKDDTSFSYAFPGGLDIDETFFTALRTEWRTAISENQTRVKDTTSGVFLGLKKKEEEGSPLTTQE